MNAPISTYIHTCALEHQLLVDSSGRETEKAPMSSVFVSVANPAGYHSENHWIGSYGAEAFYNLLPWDFFSLDYILTWCFYPESSSVQSTR